ncbi:hypothetical protein AAFC00_000973 [Neodothiora populina]|uniref:Anaphase-promoting complex subunit CDC26 n=1 Tax=Neodothiora populina TaxID=2781224 RepID=A0ABR3PMD0_9PEZI
MLRRQPTKITLVHNDILAFDQRKAELDSQKRKREIMEAATASKGDPFTNSSARDDPFAQGETRSRDQRIGL